MTIDEVMTVGKTMAASGYFQDAKQAAQAVVKILAGREMGFGPFASMTGINIIKSKPAIGGNLMAAAVKNHPKYDYRVVVLDADVCELAFFEGSNELGRSVFTKEDAAAAEVGKLVAPGATRNMITRFARNMLFNRAMSNGVRWYCPDVFMGAPVYTPDELGAQTNADGDILNVTPTTIAEPPPVFNPEMPEVTKWHELHDAAVTRLQYNHAEHVKNTLKQVFNGDAENMTLAGAWAALVEHQRAKQAELPMPEEVPA
jgi:hypothetical protein